MRTTICLLAALTILPLSATAENGYDNKAQETTVELLTEATTRFVQSLNDDQKSKALYPLDSKERLDYKIVPVPVKGLKYNELDPGQVALFHTVLNAGLSNQGYHKAASIFGLEHYLDTMEREAGTPSRFHGIDKYSIAIFGDPMKDDAFALRVHGHHLYISFSVADGKLFHASPLYFGASPHRVTEGPRAGWHILADEENLGRNIMKTLSPALQKKATISDVMPNDMVAEMIVDLRDKIKPEGVKFSDLNDTQQAAVKELVMEHVYNIPRDQAQNRLDIVLDGGWENVHFGWVGSMTPGEKFYYRVQGPGFIAEYCEVSMNANHIHSAWRDINGDFGRNILADHLASSPH